MGVSGTLEQLGKPEKDLIYSFYKIQTYSYIPSMFGSSKMEWNKIGFDVNQFVSLEPNFNEWIV
jgi:hypothetical protein